MTEVDVSLLIAAALVSALSLRNPRGILWIGIAALSYINGDIAWRLNLPYASAITAIGDAGVCLAVYFVGKERWEMWIWRLFQTSVAIGMMYLAGSLGVFSSFPHEAYSILMESVNWILLVLVGGSSALQLVGANVGAQRPWHRVRDLAFSIQRERSTPHFFKVW